MSPYGIAADSSGYVYVADQGHNEVQKFDQYGNYVTSWGGFNGPFGVAVDSSGYVYVADAINSRVQKFTAAGVYVSDIGTGLGNGPGQYHTPTGIAFDAAGNIYVIDLDSFRVQKFDPSGNFLLSWGGYGSGASQFKHPYSIAVDNAGNVYVVDGINKNVQKFDGSGNYLGVWGGFANPFGVTVGPDNNVYVVDAGNQNIQVFDTDGLFLYQWGATGAGDGQFYSPIAITFDPNGDAYVTDANVTNDRVQKFGHCPTQTVTETATQQDTGTITPAQTPSITSTVTAESTSTPAATETLTQATMTATPTATQSATPATATPTAAQIAQPILLKIQKSVTGDQPEAGAQITFTIAVSNDTLQSATGVVIWDTLPAQLDYSGYEGTVAPQVNGNYIYFNYPVINPGETAYVRIIAKVDGMISGYPVQNTAWCDYNDAFYAAPLRHPAISSNSVFYPLDEPAIYPNPFNRDAAVGGTLKIHNLVPGSMVTVYSLSGELVYSLDSQDTNGSWDLKNRNGNRVSPGIYYYRIDAPDSHRYTGKLFVVK